MHGLGSSGAAQMPHGTDVGPCICGRKWIFRSPPSTPLGGIHDTHPRESTQVGSRGVDDGDEDDDLANYMVVFPKARNVTNTGTLNGKFMVNEEGLPLNQVKAPDNF
jgi:hypothetical protein